MSLDLIWVRYDEVPRSAIELFDCGNYSFNQFLYETAPKWQNYGEAITYLLVSSEEYSVNKVQRIYAYASINATGLRLARSEETKYLSCAEIRMFAVCRQLQHHAVNEHGVKYTDIIFSLLLQDLYAMSVKTIGFKAICLHSNEDGLDLYKRCGFTEVTDYESANDDDKLDISGCVPLIFYISDENIYKIFEH